MNDNWITMEIVEIKRQTPSFFSVKLVPVDDETQFHFQAGQCVNVLTPAGKKACFSIASEPEEKKYIEFFLKDQLDSAAHEISGMKAGQKLKVSDPFGKGFPIEYADQLRQKGYQLRSKSEPFYEKRIIKNKMEIKAISDAQRQTERAVQKAVDVLRKSKIKGRYIYFKGKRVTSEMIKQIINVSLMEADCIAAHTIVSCGKQCVDPHDQGSGPLLAHQSIIMDVFPRSSHTRYFADMTRTFVKGKASEKLKKMYRTVREGQEIAFRSIKDGADGMKIHEAIMRRFEQTGFKTGEIGGRMQGFFHGTGHGVGLDIHEPPRVSRGRDILKAGEVVTVEPGLYYLDAGGVRIEDMVLVTKKSCINLTKFPKFLEIP